MPAIKPETTEDILELMNGCIFSAVLNAAMELGLFWLLAEKPLSAQEIAQHLDIPLNRCHYWLFLSSEKCPVLTSKNGLLHSLAH